MLKSNTLFNRYRIFFCLLYCLALSAEENIKPAPDADFKNYYQFIDSIATLLPEQQFVNLQNYIEANPHFDRAYIHLLNIMLYHGELDAAKTYFSTLANPFGIWMQAKILAIQDSISIADKYYQKAIPQTAPPLRLLDDYAEFLYAHKAQFQGFEKIERLDLNNVSKTALRAFWHRRNRNFLLAMDSISKQPDYQANNFILHFLGFCYRVSGQHAEAKTYFSRGLELAKTKGDLRFEAHNRVSLALLDQMEQKFSLAEEKYLDAISISQRIGDFYILQLAKTGIANLYYLQKKYSKALVAFKEAAKIAVSTGDYRDATTRFRNIGQTLLEMEKYNDVLPAFDTAEKFAIKTDYITELFSLTLEKGRFYNLLNLAPLSRHEYDKAYRMTENIQGLKERQYRAFVAYTDGLIKDKKYRLARSVYQDFLNTVVDAPLEYQAYWRSKIAESYYEQGVNDSAYRQLFATQAFIIKQSKNSYLDHLHASARLKMAGLETREKNFKTAIKIYNESIIEAVAQYSSDIAVEKYEGLGNVYRELGNLPKAISCYKKAVDLTETDRKALKVEQFKIGQFSKRVTPYQALARCYARQYIKNTANEGFLDTLFYYLEMSRARSLRELDGKFGTNIDAWKDSPAYPDYLEADTRLQSLQWRLRQLPDLYSDLYPHYETARYQLMTTRLRLFQQDSLYTAPRIKPVEETLAGLRKREMGLLLYHLSGERAFAIAANAHKVEIIDLEITTSELNVLLDSLLTPFYEMESKNIAKIPFHAVVAWELYSKLVQPVEERILLPPSLMIVPDLNLRRLPFEMLLTAAPEDSIYLPTDSVNYHQNFLLHKYSVLYSPGMQLSTENLQIESQTPNILVMANPKDDMIFDKQEEPGQHTARIGWLKPKPLWFADIEGDTIASIYANTKVYKRKEAAVDLLKLHAAHHQILHFATHAFVDTSFDDFSGLLLRVGADSTDDGLLMAYEIENLKLNCDLVTLSACETGRGKIVLGEGTLGLPRSFLKAGAKRVLMTLWQVNDHFTAELMPAFYEGFLKSGMTQTDALQAARRKMLAMYKTEKGSRTTIYYQHPFFWGPFSIYGKVEAVKEKNFIIWAMYGVGLIVLFMLLLGLIRRLSLSK